MPELPEVETFARYFITHAVQKRIKRVHVHDERILGTRREPFIRALRGQTFRGVRRHGKHLFADAGKQWLHLHFGMSGDLTAYRESDPMPRFARVVLDFDNGTHLAFEDMRLFGVAELTPSPEFWIAEHGLGPDAMDPAFRLRQFRAALDRKRGAIKSLLLAQEIVAGIGNLYADEILFRSEVHPAASIDRLEDGQIAVLYRNMRHVLKEAVARRTTEREIPVRWLMNHRQEGALCLACGGTIQRTVVFGRTTYYCGTHQSPLPGGKSGLR